MKVILTADLPHVGQVGQVVDVANGYGRNYLIPRGFAIPATPGNERGLAAEHCQEDGGGRPALRFGDLDGDRRPCESERDRTRPATNRARHSSQDPRDA